LLHTGSMCAEREPDHRRESAKTASPLNKRATILDGASRRCGAARASGNMSASRRYRRALTPTSTRNGSSRSDSPIQLWASEKEEISAEMCRALDWAKDAHRVCVLEGDGEPLLQRGFTHDQRDLNARCASCSWTQRSSASPSSVRMALCSSVCWKRVSWCSRSTPKSAEGRSTALPGLRR
jgi:hypothetical protein